jgi:CRISPR type I-E-associated protein CasA/Cse1
MDVALSCAAESIELATAFDPFADAFVLDGEGPRFLQDFDALDGEVLPVESLFIEAPGANTIKLNKDLFVKRGQSRMVSRAATAMAVYTLQQFAPSGARAICQRRRQNVPKAIAAALTCGRVAACICQASPLILPHPASNPERVCWSVTNLASRL